MTDYPQLLHTVLDARDVRGEAEFWRAYLGLVYRPGDEVPLGGDPDVADWLVLTRADGTRVLAIQEAAELVATTWPRPDVPMQLHLDFTVPDRDSLELHRRRALELGATDVFDRSEDPDEALYVLADPAGHPFCIFVD